MEGADDSQTNLIINYLPQHLSDEEFKSIFDKHGTVKTARIIRDKRTGYSYGFGFIDYSTPEEAVKAIEALNGHELQHKRIKVAYSRPQKGVNLYIKGFPKNMTQESLAELMQPYGDIVQCRILTDNYTGQSKGVGFVLYSTQEQADTAIASCNGLIVPGAIEPLLVKIAEGKKAAAPSRNTFGHGFGGMGNVPPGAGFYGSGDATYAQSVSGPDMYAGAGRGGGPMRNPSNRPRYNPLNGGGAAPGMYGAGAPSGGAPSAAMYGNGSPAMYGSGASVGVYGSGSPTTAAGGHTLFVYNIGSDATEQTLWDMFLPFGAVSKVNVIYDHQKNQCKGFGFVTMVNHGEACYAISNLNGYNFCGKPLQVSLKKDKSDSLE